MGHAPFIPFTDGLRTIVEWYQDNRRWWEPLRRSKPPPADGKVTAALTRARHGRLWPRKHALLSG